MAAEAMPAQRCYVITPGAHSWEMAELGFLDPVPCYDYLPLLWGGGGKGREGGA